MSFIGSNRTYVRLRDSAAPTPKGEPVRRPVEVEKRAYGRIFKGCGMQADYDATTKLGEGTFGYGSLFIDLSGHSLIINFAVRCIKRSRKRPVLPSP